MYNYKKLQVNIFRNNTDIKMSKFSHQVPPAHPPTQGYDNTSMFSSKAAELIRLRVVNHQTWKGNCFCRRAVTNRRVQPSCILQTDFMNKQISRGLEDHRSKTSGEGPFIFLVGGRGMGGGGQKKVEKKSETTEK